VATTLNEIAGQARVGILLDETTIPVRPEVQAVCEILGFDPLYLANEGKMLVVVEHVFTEQVLNIMNDHPYGREARVIGRVTAQPVGQVGLRTAVGGIRLLDMLAGDQLPRIC
ncbi:MAG: AIR synthase-related protein, partial [Negativicutes bacterium]|nr:AIR synthase-related protein [Negativicutes bacterium]